MTNDLPRVACIVTVWFPRSHADVIVTKLLADATHPGPRDLERFSPTAAARDLTESPLPTDPDGRLRQPRLRVVSLFVEQVPSNDVSREWAERHGVPIAPTIHEALTLGGADLAVDGVLLVGEHGDYPYNERNQKMYPRRRLFEEIVEVFRATGRSVPVFNDKHLGYAWDDAKWMYDQARTLGFPLLAGSSVPMIPIGWRRPSIQLPLETPVESALAIGYGHVEQYGFHTLEALQCLVERRAGGETGVAAVQALAGADVWDRQPWDPALLEAALAAAEGVQGWQRPAGDLRQHVPEPAVFLIEYRDGLRAVVPMLEGFARHWSVALRTPSPEIVATCYHLHGQEPFGHFAWQVEAIADMVESGRSPHPTERTLLTTGILDRAMESIWRGGARLETPELAIAYRAG